MILTTATGPNNTTVTAGSGTIGRTVPDRLVERVINAKDFGATGNGSTDDQPVLQSIIDYMYSIGGNLTLYLPAGTYQLGTRLRVSPTYPYSGKIIRIVGAGRDVTILKGSYAGSTIPMGTDPSGLVVAFCMQPIVAMEVSGSGIGELRDLTIWNTNTTAGAYAMLWQLAIGDNGAAMSMIDNCRFIGVCGLFFDEATFGGFVRNCLAQHPSTIPNFPTADQYVPFNLSSPSSAGTSEGFSFGQDDHLNNLAIGYDIGFAYHGDTTFGGSMGNACMIAGNKAFRCKVGFGIGYSTTAAGGSLIAANWADRCQIGFMNNFFFGMVGGNCVTGTSGPADPANISNVTTNGTMVTVTTSAKHNIPNGTSVLLSAGLSGWFPTGNTTGIVPATFVGPSSFSFPSANSSGVTTGTWTYPVNAGMSVIGGGALAGNYLGGDASNLLTPSAVHLDLNRFGTLNATSQLALVATYAPSWGAFPSVLLGNFAPTIKAVSCSGPGFDQQRQFVNMPLPHYGARYFPASFYIGLDVGDVYYVSDAPALAFGATLLAELTTSSATASGTQLHFASVPPNIVAGMFVYDITGGLFPGLPAAATGGWTVISVVGNDVNISHAVNSNVPAGAHVGFSFSTGTNKYKMRYDGVGWVRMG